MERRREIMVNVSKKVVDDINAMSFENLDDDQLHSLMMMREIARGVVDNRVEKVTEDDLKKTLTSSIAKMVGSCKDVNDILSKIPCEGMDEQQTHSVSRMKAIVSAVAKRAKLATTRNHEVREPVELQIIQVNGADEEIVESKVGIKDVDPEQIQRRLFGNDMHAQPINDNDDSSSETTDANTEPANGDSSSSQTTFGSWMGPRVDFEALGISNPPSWSVKLPDGAGGTKDVQVLKAPSGSVIEGMPLSSYLPEPHRSAFEYLLELIAALKHVISTRETPNGAGKQ